VLSNIGLGPAVLVSTRLFLDDELIGGIDQDSVNRLRAKLETRPSASTFVLGEAIGKDANVALLSLPNYDRETNAEFVDLISSRLSIESNMNHSTAASISVHHGLVLPILELEGTRSTAPAT
jgi:hypothetical protein